MTGIKAHNRFLGYSNNPNQVVPVCASNDGTNRMTQFFFGKADRGWILYGLMNRSKNWFFGYCVVDESAAAK